MKIWLNLPPKIRLSQIWPKTQGIPNREKVKWCVYSGEKVSRQADKESEDTQKMLDIKNHQKWPLIATWNAGIKGHFYFYY